MSTFLKSLRRAADDEVSELQALATRLETQHATLGPLLQHGDRAIAQLQRLATLGERVEGLERQVGQLEGHAEKFARAEREVARLTGAVADAERRAAEADERVARARAEVEALLEAMNGAAELRESIGEITSVTGPFRQLVSDMDALGAQVDGFRGLYARMRDEHDVAMAGYKAAITRLSAMDLDAERLVQTVTESGHRLSGLEQLLADLAPVTEGMVQTRRELATAKAIADQLAQKVMLLEGQREAIDRATAKLDQLAALSLRADQGLERHAQLAKSLTDLQARSQTLEGQHALLHDRGQELAERLERVEGGQGTLERSLTEFRTALDQGGERLALEQRGVEAVTKQVAELRRIMAETETKLSTLSTEAASLAQAAARSEGLGVQLTELARGLEGVTEAADRARATGIALERLEAGVELLTQRTLRVEESRPLLDATVRDLGGLTATSEAIADALEQLRVSREELKQAQGSVDATSGWLKDTSRALGTLREDVAALDRMRAVVDALRQELDQVTAQASSIEARRAVVEEVQRRLGEAATLGAGIEERSRGLGERLGIMEGQLGTIMPRLEEVGRAGSQLVGLQAELRGMDERMSQVQATVTAVEGRVKHVEVLGERMEELDRQVEQRASAVRRASEHLDRATQLRQDAAQAADQLQDRVRELEGALARAGERAGEVDALAKGLDGQVTMLSGVQDRLAAFETRLSEWRGAEQQVAHALEQAEARQAAISTLQAEIRNLYTMAERTQADARVIVEAEPRLSQARSQLETLMARMHDGEGLLRTLGERRRQLGRAEERLAQADTLLSDVRAGLEVLLAQKAQVDHFLEQASALGVEVKHAEATLSALRDERRLSDRIRGSLAELQRRDATAEADRGA